MIASSASRTRLSGLPQRVARGALGAAVAGVLLSAGMVQAQRTADAFPFQPGEACSYQGNGPLGRMGSGTFAVERQDSAGREAYLLRFDFRGRLGIVGVENHTRSWFDPAETASFRFTKMERSPLSTRRQDISMDAAARQWSGSGERGGAMPTRSPLDELSFIYFIRTLRLADGDSYSFDRHYDTARNPVRIRVIGRGVVRVPAGEFQTIEVEMRVRDTRHYGGEGIVRLHFTDDARRIPVRLESRIPVAGRMVLALQAVTGSCGASPLLARAAD